MRVFVVTIFLSAFLLFQVQPIIARYILPWFGGTPAVWTTCMLFFQLSLLAGYAYAHGLVVRWRDQPRWQAGIHLALIAVSLLFLPITPDQALTTSSASDPTLGIVLLLLRTVGLPFLVISASGPLMQHWFATSYPGKSPYRLYAVSNLGSLLALISYPFLIEPVLGLRLQTQVWSGTYIIYGVLAVFCARQILRASPSDQIPHLNEPKPSLVSVPIGDRVLWGIFATLGSVLLLSVTNKMTQDIAVVPFLWILPLALYLLSFIICFDHDRWYRRDIWIPLAVICVGSLVYLLNQDFNDNEPHIILQIVIYVSAMFTCCMICHGEMVRLKPAPQFLTSFYLIISLGGAMGGLLVSQVSPRIFSGYWELHASLLAIAVIVTCLLGNELFRKSSLSRVKKSALVITWVPLIFSMIFFLDNHIQDETNATLVSKRGFCGVLRVYESNVGKPGHRRDLYHGRIKHGQQFVATEETRAELSAYYMANSGVAILSHFHPKHLPFSLEPMKIGVVGLGIGTLATLGKEGDTVKFYEINPDVESLARSHFYYLSDSRAETSVALRDASTSLETELATSGSQGFDILVIDAFSGDSIPLHLLTVEAFQLYLKHLNSGGALAIHITNIHLDLSDPVRTVANELNLHAIWIERDAVDPGEYYSSWILLSPTAETLDLIASTGLSTAWEKETPRPILWSDDYSNLFRVIKWD